MRVLGVDVSKWQGKLDWNKINGAIVDGSPVQFGVAKATNGLTVDPRFADNAEGLKVMRWWGFYHWFVPNLDPVAQGNFFADQIMAVGTGILPPTVDFEDDSKGTVRGAALVEGLKTLIDTIEQRTGRGVMLYTGNWFWAQACGDVDSEWAASKALWHAEYRNQVGIPSEATVPRLPKPWASRGIRETIWQFDGNKGLVLPGGVDTDFNIFRGDEDALDKFCKDGIPATCPTGTQPVPTFENLKAVQTELEAEGYDVGGVDGVMGPKTKQAIIAFQQSHSLLADGIVGSGTRKALAAEWSKRNAD